MKKLLTLCLLAMLGSGLMAQENPSTEELSTLQQKVFFYYVYTDLNEASKQVLEEKAALLLKYPTLKLQINGHSCSTLNKKAQKISEKRALAVKDFFLKKGVSADRMSLSSFGDSQPSLAKDTEYAKIKNRRVEFQLL